MSTATITIQGLERFTPSTREAMYAAQREAVHMNAASVDPEHLLLGIIVQGDERVMNLLGSLGMDARAVRVQAAEFSQARGSIPSDASDLPLSREAQECVGWALAFVSHMHASSVFPDHLLLGVLRHPRTQPLLSFLLPSTETMQTRISETMGPGYTGYVDQLIQTRVRDQSIVNYGRGIFRRVLRRFERPVVTCIDVVELDGAKRELRDVVEFLKATPMFQLSGGRFPHGLLLIGASGNDRKMLAQATAGEAIVPLITLSMPALVEMLVDLQTGAMHFEDLALPAREYTLFNRGSIPEKGQRYIQYVFQQAKTVSPSILYIEDIDAVAKLGRNEGREPIVRQLLAEMDALDKHYRTVVIAGASRRDDLDPALMRIGRFERQIDLESGPTAQSAVQMRPCSSCRRDIQSDWQYCAYCGALQTKACAYCGAPLPAMEGARFCAACGCAFA
jgi:SpoVK/Ycf46/Vps4 family AAA+-type ATPase